MSLKAFKSNYDLELKPKTMLPESKDDKGLELIFVEIVQRISKQYDLLNVIF